MTVGSTTALWRNVVTLVGSGVAVGLGVPALATPPTYHLVDLGTLGGNSSYGSRINANGQVSGTDTNTNHAFRSSGKTAPITLTNLGTLGGNNSQGIGINNGGQVVGSSDTTTTGQLLTHAFRTTGNTMEDLGTLGGNQSYGNGINNNGQVTGTALNSNGSHAFRSTGNGVATVLTDLGAPGTSRSSGGIAINDSGEVAGNYDTFGLGSQARAFRTTGNTAGAVAFTDLGTLGGTYSRATDINTFGQVVGTSETAVANILHAYITTPTSAGTFGLTDLGTLGGDNSRGSGVDTFGDVVGDSQNAGGLYRGFVYTGGQMYDLGSLVDNLGGYVIGGATGINDNGDIIANGGDGINFTHALLLTRDPAATPEPGAVAMLSASGLGGLVMLRRRRKK